jgi:ribokinase
MNKRILVIGSATVDLIFQGAIFQKRKEGDRLSLAYGGKYVVENFYQFFGGGAANASVSLARQNYEIYLWAKIAKDNFGQAIYKNLQQQNINLTLVDHNLEKSPISAILLDKEGFRTIINYRSLGDTLNFNSAVKKLIPSLDCLALFSLPRWPKEEKLAVLRLAKKNKLKIFLSLHGDEYRKGLSWAKDYFSCCDILDLNVYELATLLDKKSQDLNLDKENFAEILGIPIVLVTHDKTGSHFYSKNQSFWQSPLKLERVDTTGAGDAFSAGFLGKYLKTQDPKLAMQFAAQNAKAEIEVIGAQTGLLYDK